MLGSDNLTVVVSLIALLLAATCTAIPVRISEDDFRIMRRLGLLPDGPVPGAVETFDFLDLDRLAERLLAQGEALSSPQLPVGNEQHLSSSLYDDDQPKARQTRSLHHGHDSNNVEHRPKYVPKTRDGYLKAAYYAPSVRRATPSQAQPSSERQHRRAFSKRSGSNSRGAVASIRTNRQIVRVLPISTRTRQNRLRAYKRGA